MPHKKAPPVRHDDPKMAGERARTEVGKLRRKRSDTHVKTIEEQYHVDFDVRGDMNLGTLLERERADSLTSLIKKHT